MGQQREYADGKRYPNAGTLRTPQERHHKQAQARRDVEIQKAQVEDLAVGDHCEAGGDDPAALSRYGGDEAESSPKEDFDGGCGNDAFGAGAPDFIDQALENPVRQNIGDGMRQGDAAAGNVAEFDLSGK